MIRKHSVVAISRFICNFETSGTEVVLNGSTFCSLPRTYLGLAKRSQHFNATSCNIVGRNMLRTLGHPVAICCDMLDDVGSNLKTVKFFVQHFGCCMMLYSFGHVHATLLH